MMKALSKAIRLTTLGCQRRPRSRMRCGERIWVGSFWWKWNGCVL